MTCETFFVHVQVHPKADEAIFGVRCSGICDQISSWRSGNADGLNRQQGRVARSSRIVPWIRSMYISYPPARPHTPPHRSTHPPNFLCRHSPSAISRSPLPAALRSFSFVFSGADDVFCGISQCQYVCPALSRRGPLCRRLARSRIAIAHARSSLFVYRRAARASGATKRECLSMKQE